MKLNTVEDVTAAIREIIDGDHPNDMKSVARKLRASRLADLYEVRASMWHELNVAAHLNDAIGPVYGQACAQAEQFDRNQVVFFRREAGAR